MGTCLGLITAVLLIVIDPPGAHSLVYAAQAPFLVLRCSQ
jgi:hypothetical protein